MHLIGHQAAIGGSATHDDHSISQPTYDDMIYRVKFLMQRYFQNSCCPNVFQFTRGGKTIWYSAKPIKMGEKLFISHFPIDKLKSLEGKQLLLWKQVKAKCQCPRCKGKTISSAQREQLTTDPAYCFIQSNKQHARVGQLKSLMDACVTVLRRFGVMKFDM